MLIATERAYNLELMSPLRLLRRIFRKPPPIEEHHYTFWEAAQMFMQYKTAPGRWKNKTRKNNNSTFTQFRDFLNKNFPGVLFHDITKAHCQAFIDYRMSMGIVPVTIQKQTVHLSNLFNWHILNTGLITVNPMSRTEKPTVHTRIKPFMNEDQAIEFLSILKRLDHDIAYTYIRTALRPGELLRPRYAENWTPPVYEPQFKTIRLDTSKTGEPGRVPLVIENDGGKLINIIGRYCTPTGDILFPVSAELFRDSIKSAYCQMHLERKGYDVQCLRRTAAYFALKYTGNIRLCQKFLRHTSIETTIKFYADMLPDDVRDGLEKIEIGDIAKAQHYIQQQLFVA